ncbi:MAG TPA: ATP-dependent DNA helicase UvrD2 [Acidimicrobiia bacterium]
MVLPGPPLLGRGVVVRAGAPVPSAWRGLDLVRLDAQSISDDERLGDLVDGLHRRWVASQPVVVEWDVADDTLAVDEQYDGPVWRLDASFLFPLERLRFLAFSNNYDARSGDPRWWWAHKAAARIGGTPGGPADLTLPDGTDVWIDGGPRRPLAGLDHPVIHGESAELGQADHVAPRVAPDDGLAADQLAAVTTEIGAARIIAPAGSGKTRTLVARFRHLVDGRQVSPRHVMAVAYNARAADQMRQRLGTGRDSVRTIHSLGWAILADARPGLSLVDEREVRDLLGSLVTVPARTNTDPLGPYIEALEMVRAGLRSPAAVESERDDVEGFADAFERYRALLYDRSRVDHGEQVYGAIEALLGDQVLRSRWQERCKHMLVDEFQDLTPAYLLLLRLLASPQLQVFGVGDDDQVIYGYAGADPGFLIDYDAYFPGADHHALAENYRCPPDVVSAATRLLSYNERRIAKTITSASGRADGLTWRAAPGPGLAAEAAAIVAKWLDDGVSPAQVTVLTRVNSALIPVKAAFVQSGIATSDLLGEDSLRRTLVRALFSWIRLATDREAMRRADLLEAIRRPGRGLTRLSRELLTRQRYDLADLRAAGEVLDAAQAERWSGFVADVAACASAAGGGAGALVDMIVDDIGLGSAARTLDSGRLNAARSGHVDDLVAIRRAAELHTDASDLEAWLTMTVRAPSDANGATLSTVHRVKGMEWDRVIVFGVDRGSMPHTLSDDVEEERRVFHVAVTRGAVEVVVLYDSSRASPFIAELAGTAPRRAPQPPRQEPRRIAVATGDTVRVLGGHAGQVSGMDETAIYVELATGAQLAVPRDEILEVTPRSSGRADTGLVEALKAWRLETSRRLGVPAYVLLHDSTIEAIATALPGDEQGLLAVPGIGPSKLESYGDEILGIVAAR